MYAVIFEVKPKTEGKDEYLNIAAELRRFLENRDGFISIERFQSLTEEGKLLSLSFWRDEAAIEKWRNLLEHRTAQLGVKDKLEELNIEVKYWGEPLTQVLKSGKKLLTI